MRLYHNLELSKHIDQVQVILDHHCSSKGDSPHVPHDLEHHDVNPIPHRGGEFPTSIDLLSRTGPNKFDSLQSIEIQLNQSCIKQPQENLASLIDSSQIQELEDIIDNIAQLQSNVCQQYAHDLKQSLEALKKLKRSPKNTLVSIDADMLSAEIFNTQRATNDQFDRICEAFKKGDRRAE